MAHNPRSHGWLAHESAVRAGDQSRRAARRPDSGESKIDEGMNRTLYYKDIVKAAEDDVSLLLFIREELKICMEIIKQNR